MARLPNNLPDLLRAAGLTVVEFDGWEDRGRPASSGRFDPDGNLHHHTGSEGNGRDSARWMFFDGRPDLPPPLCQLSTDRQGVVYLGAAGRANHAGTARASGPMPSGDGNELYVGWEHQNSGTQPWPKAQYEAMVTAAAVLDQWGGWPASHNRAHRETSITGKWDPGGLDMDRFREDIAAKKLGRKPPKMTDVQKGNIVLTRAINTLTEAIQLYDNADDSRVAVWARIARLKSARVILRWVRRTMPPK